jgi:EmrB/QacA subfamily drug resistance transporter
VATFANLPEKGTPDDAGLEAHIKMINEINNQETATVSKNVVLLIAIMSSFLTPFTSSSINIALPSIGTKLSMDAVSLNWVATAYLLAAATFLVPFGRIADIQGRKRIFQIGIIIDMVASILCGIAPSGEWLIIFRFLQGFGGSMIFGTSVAILTSVFPAQERGRALGFSTAAVYTGLSVGPLIGGLITQHYRWEGIFFLNAFLGMVISAVVFLKLKGEWAGARGEKFDYTGSILFCLSMVILVYALSLLPALWGLGLIFLALVGFAFFLVWEARQEFPVLKVDFFRKNTVFAFSNLAAFINYSATAGAAFLLSLYMQYVNGFTPEHAGLILITQPIVMVICSPIAGNLSDRVEPRIVSSIGMGFVTIGLVMLIFLGSHTGLIYVLASLFVLGLGFGFFTSPNTNAVMSSVDRKFYGVASGTLGTMRLTGQVFSLALVLLLFSLYIGKVQITPQYFTPFLKAMKIAFCISAVLCFAGIFASIARGKTHG